MSTELNNRERPDRMGDRDYFRQATPIERWKLRLTVIGVLVTVGWLAAGLLRPNYGVDRFTHGTLTNVHSTWDNECEACHVPFEPINQNTWLHQWVSAPTSSEAWRNTKCEGCHAGPVHHTTIKPEKMQTCGACHRDHQGRDHSLVSLPDSDCTSCHENLNATMIQGPSIYANVIRGFPNPKDGHPEFRVHEKFDPEQRGLKFSHALHMTPGIEYDRGSLSAWTYEKLIQNSSKDVALRYLAMEQQTRTGETPSPTQLREMLAMPSVLSRPLVLNCAACHQLDTQDFRVTDAELKGLPLATMQIPRNEGVNFQPVNFDKHCAACHNLEFSDAKTAKQAVPHRVQAPELEKYLQSLYAGEVLSEQKAKFDVRFPVGERLDGRTTEIDRSLKEEIDNRVRSARKQVIEGQLCIKCHGVEGEGAAMRIQPTNIPTIWMKNAKFDHSAHRASACISCHDGTSAPEKLITPLVEKEPSHLPAIDNCRQCHTPATSTRGGARYNCTECHTYHDGDHALAGRGSLRWDPLRKYEDAVNFRRGTP